MKHFLLTLALVLFSGLVYADIPEYEMKQTRDVRVEQYVANWMVDNYPKAINPSVATTVAKELLRHSQLYQLDLDFLIAIVAIESGFQTRARSPSGALGLMQVVPRWHKDKIRKRNLNNPSVAIEVGSQILREYLDKARQNTTIALKYYCGYKGHAAVKYVKSIRAKQKQFKDHLFASMMKDDLNVMVAFSNRNPVLLE